MQFNFLHRLVQSLSVIFKNAGVKLSQFSKCRRHNARSIEFTVTLPNGTIQKGDEMVTLTTVQEYTMTVTGETDAKGHSVPLPTLAFIFRLSDATLGILTSNADGVSATFVAQKVGVGNITVTDPSNSALTAVSNFTITAAPAVAIQFTESAPIAQP